MGDARGHWEGNTLVVETTNFTDKTPYRGSSDQLRLVERFTPIGPDTVEWAVTVDDPHTWARPWTFAMKLTEDESQPPFEYACHEGNYGLRNILTAARAEEKARRGIEQVKANMRATGVRHLRRRRDAGGRRAQSSAQSYKAPRTPWGDPDIQGNYTNLTETGTPLERPKEFEGRNSTRSAARNCARSSAGGGTDDRRLPRARPRRPTTGGRRHTATRARRQAWLVIDPPDGKIPPLTPEAQQRQRRAPRRAAEHARSGRLVQGSQPLRPLHHARLPGSMMPAIYGNSSQIVQGQGYVAIRYEMIHETRVIPLDAAPHVGKSIRSTWAMRAATGKATRSSSRRRTSTSAASTATPIPSGCS